MASLDLTELGYQILIFDLMLTGDCHQFFSRQMVELLNNHDLGYDF